MRHLIWIFTVCKSTHLGVSSIQRIKKERTHIYELPDFRHMGMVIHVLSMQEGVPNLRTCTIFFHYAFSITNVSFFFISKLIQPLFFF